MGDGPVDGFVIVNGRVAKTYCAYQPFGQLRYQAFLLRQLFKGTAHGLRWRQLAITEYHTCTERQHTL